MKKLLTGFLAALLAVSLTSCSLITIEVNPPASGPQTSAESPQEAPGETPAALPEEPPEEPPEEAGDPLEGLASAPAFARYPEHTALESLEEDGVYTSKEDVALYIWSYDALPQNFITKNEARALGWSGGGLEAYAPGCCIGGDRSGNYEGLLPEVEGRTYYECDIDTLGAGSRGAKRLVFCYESEDHVVPQIYYTEDHYESFEMVYGDDAPGEAAND